MKGDLVLAIFLAAVFSLALVEVTAYRWQVALAPGLSAGIGLALMGSQILRDVFAAPVVPRPSLRDRLRALAPLAWFLSALVTVTLLGFAAGGALYVFAQVLAVRRGPRRFAVAALCALAVPLTVLGLFEGLLDIRLFPGLAFN